MAIATDQQIRAAIKTRLIAGSGASTRVITRWKLSVDPEEWAGVARSLTDTSVIDGWLITRTKVKTQKLGHLHWEHDYHYTLWYLRSVREGAESDNSENDVNQVIENCLEEFELNPTIGFDIGGGDGVHSHSELQIEDIDIVKDQMHVVQAALVVHLTKQP